MEELISYGLCFFFLKQIFPYSRLIFFVIFTLLPNSMTGAPSPLLYRFLVHIVNREVSEQLFWNFFYLYSKACKYIHKIDLLNWSLVICIIKNEVWEKFWNKKKTCRKNNLFLFAYLYSLLETEILFCIFFYNSDFLRPIIFLHRSIN